MRAEVSAVDWLDLAHSKHPCSEMFLDTLLQHNAVPPIVVPQLGMAWMASLGSIRFPQAATDEALERRWNLFVRNGLMNLSSLQRPILFWVYVGGRWNRRVVALLCCLLQRDAALVPGAADVLAAAVEILLE
jgi:hypothetical protein